MKHVIKRLFLYIVLFLMLLCFFIIGSIYQIYELYQVAAIILGWILATFSINLYQKRNLERDLRDKMFKEYEITFKSAGKSMMAWTMWVSDPSNEARFFNVTSELWGMVAGSQTFANRLINTFKLSDVERTLLETIIELTDEWTEIINHSLANRDISINMRSKILSISKKYQKNIQLTFFIILNSEI